jgi:hypothetical protein
VGDEDGYQGEKDQDGISEMEKHGVAPEGV